MAEPKQGEQKLGPDAEEKDEHPKEIPAGGEWPHADDPNGDVGSIGNPKKPFKLTGP